MWLCKLEKKILEIEKNCLMYEKITVIKMLAILKLILIAQITAHKIYI